MQKGLRRRMPPCPLQNEGLPCPTEIAIHSVIIGLPTDIFLLPFREGKSVRFFLAAALSYTSME